MRRAATALLLVLLLVPAVAAAEEATWIRYPALSPDATRIVFAYRGDLWIVATEGGDARRLTTHEGLETRPVWSRDGTRIAFASDRYGNFDVFVIASTGGAARRVTWHSASDFPCDFEPDGSRVLFTSRRQDDPSSILPSASIPELWSVPTEGGRPRRELTTPAEWARVSPDGRYLVYEDRRGYENTWRKHHVSPVTRDVWVHDRTSGSHDRLTVDGCEDRNPVWPGETGSDRAAILFLSQCDGTYNVYRSGEPPARLTTHDVHPVRFLSAGTDGTYCYGFNGAVFVASPGEAAVRVPIRAAADARRNPVQRTIERKGATEMAVSPDGEEVAFVVRGEVFVASVEHGTTKRITHTPEQERSVAWSPDGTSLYYAGERHHDDSDLPSWNLYRAKLAREDDERLFRATLIEEDVLWEGTRETFQPVPSPDGRTVAFLRDRDELCALDLETRSLRTLVPAARNYSYADGDIRYTWSPDSRWIAVTYLPNRSWIEQIGVVDVEAGTVRDVTLSGYYESEPRWSPDGRFLAFRSNRHGRRSHGSWGSDQDVLALYLTQAAHDRATLDEEEYDRLRDREEKEAKEEKGKEEDDEDAASEAEDDAPPAVEIEWEGLERRLRRLTFHSAPISDYVISKDGETCLYAAEMDGRWHVWMVRPRQGETRRLVRLGDERGPRLALSKDGKTLFLRRADGRIATADVENALRPRRNGRSGRDEDGDDERGGGPRAWAKGVPYAADLEIDADAERRHLFEHIWRQAGAKFYREDLHGADWPALRANYERFLPEVENGYEFAELASELLGELNASHTGCRYRPDVEEADATASLGLLFREDAEDDGLLVAEVVRGGPSAQADSRIRPGHVLLAIDGNPLDRAANPWRHLRGKAGRRVRLTLREGEDATYEQVVRPISLGDERRLLYRRLIERRRAIVDEASGGRVGYVHVAGMNDRSFRETFRESLGRHADREALVVDTRFNGGGWLHDDLVVFLSGERYMDFVPRGKERGSLGGEPLHRWDRPSCVLMSEGNYSDAHLFPVAYRMHGIGKLVGAPVAGTGTAVWWERLIDPALVFGIPQVGMVDPDGNYMENLTLEPDVEVLMDPVQVAAGVDQQLLAAVRVLLEELDADER